MEHFIDNFKHKLGMNCLTTSLRDILHFNGYDYNEDFCLGLSGAFSFWYSKNDNFIQATGLGNNIFEEAAAVLKLQHQYLYFDDNEKAWDVACQYINHNIPVILDVELAGYVREIDAMRDDSKVEKKMLSIFDTVNFRVGGHVTTLVGYDEKNAYLCENMFYKPVGVPIQALKTARNPKDIQFVPPHNGMHVFFFPERLPSMEHVLKAAITRVIHNMELCYLKPVYCYGGMTYECSGHKGIEQFMNDVEQIMKNKTEQGYTQVLALVQILNRWGGNEVNRNAYSRFLRQASQMLNNNSLLDASDCYQDSSKLWKQFLRELDKNVIEYDKAEYQFISDFKKQILEKETLAVSHLQKAVS